MPSLKILSWNIQKFGESKLNDSHFIEYVSLVIHKMEADVVGIMELVGWKGNEIAANLVSSLDNRAAGTGITWHGFPSEMTPSRPDEQYLFLVKNNLFVSEPETRLSSVMGENDFDEFFSKNNYGPQDQEKFWKSLFNNGFLDAAFRVPMSKWLLLNKDHKDLELTKKKPKVQLSPQQKKAVVDLLLIEQPMGFPMRGSRPPFLMKATTKATPTPITFVLFHAPGPTGNWPQRASNQLGFVKWVDEAKVGIIMGDFNVAAKAAMAPTTLEYFDPERKKLVYVKDVSGQKVVGLPFQKLTGPPFTLTSNPPYLSGVLAYKARLWSDKTSIKPAPSVSQTQVANPPAVLSLRSSEYDKFFVLKPTPLNPDPTPPRVVPLIDFMVPKMVSTGVVLNGILQMKIASTTPTPYHSDLAVLATNIFNKWWDDQSTKQQKSKKTHSTDLTKIPKLVGRPPQSLHEAHYVYRHAISDHLPILMELEYA